MQVAEVLPRDIGAELAFSFASLSRWYYLNIQIRTIMHFTKRYT